jgi:hypothetical protein
MENEEEEGGEEEDEQPKQPDEQQPPRKITKNIRGLIREYHFLKTVESMEELDKFRFSVMHTIK